MSDKNLIECLGQAGLRYIQDKRTWNDVAKKLVVEFYGARGESKQGCVVALKKSARHALSYLPAAGLIPKPNRPKGVSVIIRVKNEEDWLETSIRSLIGFADEIIVGDNGSTDKTPETLENLRREYPEILRVYSLPDLDILALTNHLIDETSYRWIARWDADFVAQTDGTHNISNLKERLFNLPDNRYFFFYLYMVEVAGDFWHQNPRHPTRADAHLWTASPALRYVYDPTGYESPRVPIWYEVNRWEQPNFYHMHIKSDERLFQSFVWKNYLTRTNADARLTPAEFEREFYRRRFGSEDADNAMASYMLEYLNELIPLQAGRYPNYPALIKPFLDRPRYRIIYKKGKIIGRENLAVSKQGR